VAGSLASGAAPLNRARTSTNVPSSKRELFRAVAKGQGYGLSARGLALNTAEASGEEFRSFARSGSNPPPRARVLVVHCVLDPKPSNWGYRFTIRQAIRR